MPKVLGLTTSAFDPASRVRFIQFIPHLKKAGWEVEHRPNSPDRLWSSSLPGRIPRALHHRTGKLLMKVNRLRDIKRAKTADVVFVNRDLAGDGTFFESRLLRQNRKVIYDFDDAIYLGPNEAAVRWMCQNAAWVTPGNEFLGSFARQYTDRVTVVPTVIDTESYQVQIDDRKEDEMVRVGWTGSDQSIGPTLFEFLPMLKELQKSTPFELVVITNTRPQLPLSGVLWSFIPWDATGDARLADRMDIGIMPLVDKQFERGKCGLKLLQYMAAGLPTVASQVGVNAEITLQGETGCLARTKAEWAEALEALLRSRELRRRMGRRGRDRCVRNYSIATWLPRITDVLNRVATEVRKEEITSPVK